MQTKVYIGRWQCPFHEGHQALVMESIRKGYRVVIGIRDTAQDEDNPFSYAERKEQISKIMGDKVYDYFRVPDPDCDLSIVVGRKVGYEVIRLDDEIESISGTQEREQMRAEGVL